MMVHQFCSFSFFFGVEVGSKESTQPLFSKSLSMILLYLQKSLSSSLFFKNRNHADSNSFGTIIGVALVAPCSGDTVGVFSLLSLMVSVESSDLMQGLTISMYKILFDVPQFH